MLLTRHQLPVTARY